MDNWELRLSRRMLYHHTHKGFMSAITKAERGYGKSMYNLKSMAHLHYMLEDCTENHAWQKALDNIIFTPEQLTDKIDYNIANDVISPVWCIDDATVHFSSYLFFINVFQTALLNAAFDTMRTVVSALLINCPQKKRLLRSLQHYDDYEITIYKAQNAGYERKAVCIKWYSLPSGKREFRKEFEDHFSCYVPNWVYQKYMTMRKLYLKEINEQIQGLKIKLSERKQKTTEKTL